VLGGILQHPDRIPEVTTRLRVDDFETERHQKIFAGLIAGYNAGRVVDDLSGANYLLETGVCKSADDAIAVTSLVGEAPLPVSLILHVEQVADNALRRRLSAGLTRAQQAYREGAPIEDLQQLVDEIAELSADVPSAETHRIGETLDELFDEIEARGSGAIPDAVPTGFPDLDRKLNGGFKPGQMIIVAARPGVGKSTLAVDVMRNMTIRAGLPALLFSLEMSEAEVQERVVSAEAQVLITDLRTGRVDDAGWEKIGPARDALQDAPLYVDDSPELTMVEIAAKTKLAVKRHGVKLMAVDYLQLLRLGGKADSRQEEVSSISRQLKLLAKSCKIPVIAIAQLNRGVEQRGDDATPRPSDLRESGSLEQDADVVIMIHRPDVLNKDHARAGEADLIVAKHRGGDTGTVTVASQLHYSRFVSMQ
jgi:replicative DNA helicase